MVSTRKKGQSNSELPSQLDHFDQYIIICNTASDRQENTVVNEGAGDRDCTAGTSNNNFMTNENTVNVKILKEILMEELTGKRVTLLTRSNPETKTQFWPLLIVLLLLKSN